MNYTAKIVKTTTAGTALNSYEFTGSDVDVICEATNVMADYGINIAPVDLLSDLITDNKISRKFYLDGIAILKVSIR